MTERLASLEGKSPVPLPRLSAAERGDRTLELRGINEIKEVTGAIDDLEKKHGTLQASVDRLTAEAATAKTTQVLLITFLESQGFDVAAILAAHNNSEAPVKAPEAPEAPESAESADESAPVAPEAQPIAAPLEPEQEDDTFDQEAFNRRFAAHTHEDEQPVEGRVDTPEAQPAEKMRLELASDKYAELSAKHRGSHVGRFLRTSKFLVKIPGVKYLAERLNSRTDSELDTAREEYTSALKERQEKIAAELYEKMSAENPEASQEEIGRAIHLNTSLFTSETDTDFEKKLVSERVARSKPTNKFVNWWVRQPGLGKWDAAKQRFKKYGLVGGIGVGVGGAAVAGGAALGAGIVLGGMLLPGVGAFAGGAAGALIGRHVAKRRANSVDDSGVTLAERQSIKDKELKEAIIAENSATIANPNYDANDAENSEERLENPNVTIIDPNKLTAVTEKRTAEEQAENRRTTASAILAGAAGGKIVGAAVASITNGALGSLFAGGVTDTGAEPVGKSVVNAASRAIEANGSGAGLGGDIPVVEPQPPLLNGDALGAQIVEQAPQGAEFVVEKGNGLIRELQQFAETIGHNISGQNAEGLYNALSSEFGSDNLIDLLDYSQDTYQMPNGGVGINAPGAAVWRPGVEEFAQNWLTSQGL